MDAPMRTAARAAGQLDVALDAFDDDDYEDIADDEELADREGDSTGKSRRIRKAQQLPDGFALMYKQATDLYLEGDHEDALKLYKDIAKDVKNYAPVFEIMADCHQAAGRLEEAFECSKKAIAIDPRYVEAWNRFLDLADATCSDDDILKGLKAIVRLNITSLELVIPQLRRLILLLDASEVAALIKFKSRLFEAEYNSGNRSECFTLAVDVVRSMVAEKKVEAAVEFCDRFIPPAMANHDFIPYDVLAVYAEILLDAKQPERVTEFLLGFGLMQMKGPPSGSFLITDALEVMMPYCDNLALAAAACIVMLGFDNFKSIEGLLTGRILVAASFTHSKLFLDLSIGLLEKDQTLLARRLLEKLQKQPEYQYPQFYYQLGMAFERLSDIKHALDAYNRAVSLNPALRTARFRIRRLGLPVPSFANIGTAEDRHRTILLQKKIYEDYCDVVKSGDRQQIVGLAVDLITSTFGHLEEMDPLRIIFSLDPFGAYKMESRLQKHLLYAPTIATNDIPLDEFWGVIMNGCKLAFELQNFDDVLVIAFHALCTADFRPFLDKVKTIKIAIVTAGFYLRKYVFCLRYFREELTTAKQPVFSARTWNFVYLLLMEHKCTTPVMKWAFRWVRRYGYCRELTIIMANDSMRRGNYRHALTVYTLVAKREGVDNLSWQILLHMGILYVNLSCHYHCGQRLLLYTTGMMFLEKYGLRRGMCPEVPYNKGRAAHLYGDNAEAIGFYLDCLTLCHKTKIQAVPTEGTLMDYAFLAAYNLRAVYIRLKQPVQVKDLYDTILRWDKVKPRVLSK